MSTTIRSLGVLLTLVLLFGMVSAPSPTAVAHDGDFEHYEKHFHTKKVANNRFTVQRYAVVDSEGVLVRGERVVAAVRTNEGTYRVTFNREVAQCAFTVTPLAENGAVPIRFASASTGNIWGANSVGVAVFASDGSFLDGGFSIVMTC